MKTLKLFGGLFGSFVSLFVRYRVSIFLLLFSTMSASFVMTSIKNARLSETVEIQAEYIQAQQDHLDRIYNELQKQNEEQRQNAANDGIRVQPYTSTELRSNREFFGLPGVENAEKSGNVPR